MSDVALGAGWWVAADGKWHPPELRPPGVRPEIVASGPDAPEPDGGDQRDGTGETAASTTHVPVSAMDGTIAGSGIDGQPTGTDLAPPAAAPPAVSEPARPVQSAAATPIAPVRLVDTVRPVRVPPGPPPLPPEVSPFPTPPRLDEFLASRDTADADSDATPEISVAEGSDGTESVEPDVAGAVANGNTPVAEAVEGDAVLDFLADFAPAEPSGIEPPFPEGTEAAGVGVADPMDDAGFEHPVVAEAEAVVGAGLGDELFDDEDDSLSIHSLIFGGEADAAGPEPDVADADVFEAQAPLVAQPAVDMVPEPGQVAPAPEPVAAAVPVVEAVPEPAQPVVDVQPTAPVEPVAEVEPEPEPVVADAPASQQVAATAEPVTAGESEPAGEPELDDEPAADEPVAASANAGAGPARAGSAARPAGARQAPLVKGGPEFKDIFKMAMNGNSLADSVQVKYDAGSERGRVTSGSPPADDDSKRRRRRKR